MHALTEGLLELERVFPRLGVRCAPNGVVVVVVTEGGGWVQ